MFLLEAGQSYWQCLRQRISRRGEDAVPLLAGERQITPGSGIPHALGGGRADDDLEVRGMTGDPGDCDARPGDPVLRAEIVDDVVQLGEVLAVAEKRAVEPLILKRRPRLQRDAV